MLRIAAMLLLSLGVQDALGTFGAGNFSSYIDGQRWDFLVTRAALEGSPRWREAEENPPLAPRAAITSARLLLTQMRMDEASWGLQSVTLHPLLLPDAWIYLVEFVKLPPPPRPGMGGGIVGGPTEALRVVVLMDGRAIVPHVSDWRPNRP